MTLNNDTSLYEDYFALSKLTDEQKALLLISEAGVKAEMLKIPIEIWLENLRFAGNTKSTKYR